jgi:hypothetical protein
MNASQPGAHPAPPGYGQYGWRYEEPNAAASGSPLGSSFGSSHRHYGVPGPEQFNSDYSAHAMYNSFSSRPRYDGQLYESVAHGGWDDGPSDEYIPLWVVSQSQVDTDCRM